MLVDRAAERPSIAGTAAALVAYRALIRNLVEKDLKLKYRGSVLGFAWSLANPLALVAVYTLAFRHILGVQQPGFPFFVLVGIVTWTFFANSALMATGSLIENGGLLRAVRFPRAVLPVSTVLFNLAQYLLMLAVFLPVLFAGYRAPSASLALLPALVALQVAFTIGVALLLAAATTFFRDVRHFVELGLLLLFWTTPIVYPFSQVPEWLRLPILLSPMTPFVVGYHAILLEGAGPSPAVWAAALAYGLGGLLLGSAWFVSQERELIEHL